MPIIIDLIDGDWVCLGTGKGPRMEMLDYSAVPIGEPGMFPRHARVKRVLFNRRRWDSGGKILDVYLRDEHTEAAAPLMRWLCAENGESVRKTRNNYRQEAK